MYVVCVSKKEAVINVRMSLEEKVLLRAMSVRDGVTMSDILRSALRPAKKGPKAAA